MTPPRRNNRRPPFAACWSATRRTTGLRPPHPAEAATASICAPLQNGKQTVSSYRLSVTPQDPHIEYEDVFGNMTARFEITQPYTELTVTAESTVELLDVDPFAFAALPIQPSFPLVWMPWELKMLQPYLTPPELSETQLVELYDYAMSFVERNHRDLMETLFDINLTLFREYKYLPGSTSLETTPYQVFTSKQGVCQDFANIFITMARLLGSRPVTSAATSTPATPARAGRGPTRRTPGSSSTSPTSAGRGSTPPTASCRAPTTSASPTAVTTATPPRRPARCTRRRPKRCAWTWRS